MPICPPFSYFFNIFHSMLFVNFIFIFFFLSIACKDLDLELSLSSLSTFPAVIISFLKSQLLQKAKAVTTDISNSTDML